MLTQLLAGHAGLEEELIHGHAERLIVGGTTLGSDPHGTTVAHTCRTRN